MLSAPVVQSPITPCTSKVKVVNTLTGASVRIFQNGTPVGSGTADGPETFVKLNPGVTLTPGRLITASQKWNGDSSPATPDTAAVKVLNMPTPAMLGEIISRARPLECGVCLWLEGIVPGATVTVTTPGDPPITVAADWTVVHVDIPPLASEVAVQVRQAACGVVGPLATLSTALRQATGPAARIGAPSIDTPLYLCQRAVTIHQLPGAKVTLEHDDRANEFCFGSTEGTFWLSRPLEIRDRIRTHQEFLRCELTSAEAEYSPTEPVPPAPRFRYPVCTRDDQVELTGLIPGAHVQFFKDDEPEPISLADAALPPFRFNLPPLGDARRLGVCQALCEFGPWSDTTFLDLVAFGPPDLPKIVEPVLACGAAVAVTGLQAGTRVRVVSGLWGGPIGETVGDGDEFVDVPLLFLLIQGDRLHLETIECGVFQVRPHATVVGPPPDTLATPEIDDPLDDCGGSIAVRKLSPGAVLDIERVSGPGASDDIGTLLASVPVTRIESIVPVPPLELGWFIRVRQRLCDRTSRPSRIATVGDRSLHYEDNSTFRLCQLTGSGPLVPANRTFDTTDVDILGTDLGISVEHGGRIYFFFGDCAQGEQSARDGDPIGWTTASSPEPVGVKLNWLLNDKGVFRRLTVEGLPPLGNFEVPTGAFGYGGRLYVFVARDKADGKMQTSHLAVSKLPGNDPNQNLQELYKVASTLGDGANAPAGAWLIHVSPTVVRNADWPGLPSSVGDGVLMFGTRLYQESNVFLAWAPIAPGQHPPHPSTWKYFKADSPGQWVAAPTIPGVQEPTRLLNVPDPGPVAELSVAWQARMRRWIMTHMQGGQAVIRASRLPWGPWSPAEVIFDANDLGRDADNHLADEKFVLYPNVKGDGLTGPYAPYIISRWTRFDRSTRKLTLYYTMSVEAPPYDPQLMRSRLDCG